MDVFETVEKVRKLVEEVFPQIEEGKLHELIKETAKWHLDKKRVLTKEGAKVYEIMIKNNHTPTTVYRHYLLTKAPKEIQDKLRAGVISHAEAFRQKNIMKREMSGTQQDLMHDIMDCVRRYIVR